MLLSEDDSTVQEGGDNVGDEKVNLRLTFLLKIFVVIQTEYSAYTSILSS